MRILVAPHPALRETCQPVAPDEIKKLRSTVKQMAKLMYRSQGCGLAAPQVGIAKRLVVIDVTKPDDEGEVRDKKPLVFINPVITRQGGEKEVCEEGCLSIPGIQIPIERFGTVEVEALDLEGKPFAVEAEGFFARALQHEIDHLEGKTMFEHLDPIERIEALKEYEAALKAGARPGDTSVEQPKGAPAKPSAPALADAAPAGPSAPAKSHQGS
ncbi:MAG: peptide deformylase [Coriobacteriales bacterium]|jgi:peptide deformylase|nr:peptide deformylase [Coriobacteriales bacterium]